MEGIVFGILRIALSLILKIIRFTGIYWIIAYMFIYDMWIKPTGYGAKGTVGEYVLLAGLFVTFGLVLITCINNLGRFFNPSFSLANFFTREKAKTFEKLDNRLKVDDGIVFGRVGNKYITKPYTEDGHTLIIGGAGSGKSSCIAIPTLLSWSNPVFAIDIKGELSETVKMYRSNIKVFNPTDYNSCAYNPYEILNLSSNKVQGAKEISQAIIQVPENIKDPFWKQSAQNLLTSAILHFSSQNIDFPETCRKVQGTPVRELVEILLTSADENARMFANQFATSDDKVLGSIYAELSNNIMVFATDSDLQRALKPQENRISIKDLEFGNDVFIRIPEDKIEQWKGLLTLINTQFLKAFERRQDKNKLPILFLLDEFARLGKIEGIVNGLATLRSKNIHICILIQSLAQLDVIYGKEQRKVIADNCNYKAVLKATDPESQDYFSKLVGTFDKEKTSTSNNYSNLGMGNGSGTSKTTEEKRIIKPEEFAYLENPIIFTPHGFFKTIKTPYFEDKSFIKKISA